jgi:cell filamentation protein
VDDPYLQANGILRNKLALADQAALDFAEVRLTETRLRLIEQQGPRGAFTFHRLLATHAYIFQDIYDWAGQPRTTELYKAATIGGPLHRFVPPDHLEEEAERIFAALARQNYLRYLDRVTFSLRSASLMVEINQLHPFREGNGRTQRAFLQALAKDAGHELYFDVVSRERMIQASVEGSQGDAGMMQRLFVEISDFERVLPLRDAIGFFETNTYDWNDRYLATTEIGRSYEGVFVGQNNHSFMMHDGERILIGRMKDLTLTPKAGERIAFTVQP